MLPHTREMAHQLRRHTRFRDPSLTPPPLDGREMPTRERAGTMGFDDEFRTTILPQTLP